MHSTPSNIPEISTGDNIRARTLNHMADIAKANSNTNQSGGMHGYSTSSGTSYGLSADLLQNSFLAMITNGWNDGGMNSFVAGPPLKYGPEEHASEFLACENGLRAYSWVEMVENYDITRFGSEIFPIISDPLNLPRKAVSGDVNLEYTEIDPSPTKEEKEDPSYNKVDGNRIFMGPDGKPLTDPYSGKKIFFPPYGSSCRLVNRREYIEDKVLYPPTTTGRYGNADTYPLYEVNNKILPLGYITRIYLGIGRYVLTAVNPSIVFEEPRVDTNPCPGSLLSINPFSKFHPNFYIEKNKAPGCCGKYVVASNIDPRSLPLLSTEDRAVYIAHIECLKQFYGDTNFGVEGGIPDITFEGPLPKMMGGQLDDFGEPRV
jgi:hypothetical protein